MNKLLTVLIPTYNNYELFLRVIDTYLNDERVKIIVSDDSDNFIEKKSIELFCKKNNINYFEGPNKRAGDNWNNLINIVSTPFFVLNHHDEYPNNLQFLDVLKNKNIGLLVLPCSSKIGRNSYHKIFSIQQKIFSKICLFWPNASFNIILAPTACVVVNSKFKDILFDCELNWFIDADWYLRLFRTILKTKNFKINFYKFSRIYSSQAENSITNKLKTRLKKQIIKEKIYLNKKGLLPNKVFQLLQFSILALTISLTRLKKSLQDFYINFLI